MTTFRVCDRCDAKVQGAKVPRGWDMAPIYEVKKIKGQKKKRFIDMMHLCPGCHDLGARLHYDPPSISEPTAKHKRP